MEWIERLNKTITYIEEHPTEEISYDELARIACCSTYHFQRMFAYMASIPRIYNFDRLKEFGKPIHT